MKANHVLIAIDVLCCASLLLFTLRYNWSVVLMRYEDIQIPAILPFLVIPLLCGVFNGMGFAGVEARRNMTHTMELEFVAALARMSLDFITISAVVMRFGDERLYEQKMVQLCAWSLTCVSVMFKTVVSTASDWALKKRHDCVQRDC